MNNEGNKYMVEVLNMARLQVRLNVNTNGTRWTKGITDENRIINWYRCIRMEAAELIDSFNWKHWKSLDLKPDIENAKVELVDIWHFIISQYLIDNKDSIIEDNMFRLSSLLIQVETMHKDANLDPILVAENMIHATFKKDINLIVSEFSKLMLALDFKMSDLYKLYIGKNVLNEFRQENGYKDGTYVKMWDKLEDNQVMMSLMAINPTIDPEGLKSLLMVEYAKVVK